MALSVSFQSFVYSKFASNWQHNVPHGQGQSAYKGSGLWRRNLVAVNSSRKKAMSNLEDDDFERSFVGEEIEADEKGKKLWSFNEMEEGVDEEPWNGAIIFKRSSSNSRYEWETSLERLGLNRLSSPLSRSEAVKFLGQVSGDVGSCRKDVTRVVVQLDVEKEGRNLRLDGTAQTAFGVHCKWCLTPVAVQIESSFSALLSATPIEEPTKRNLGVVLGEDTWRSEDNPFDAAEDVLDLDLGDKFHFPMEMKEIDLSKYIRDTLHLDIPLDVRCDAECKGFCLDCGTNLNVDMCKCLKSTDARNVRGGGLAEQLKKQLEEYKRKKDSCG